MHKNLKSAREEYIKGHLSEAIKDNPKRFWSYVKRLKQENSGIADFEVDGKVVRATPCKYRPKCGKAQKIKIALLLHTDRL